MHVIPSSDYTLDASAGTITLGGDHSTVELAQIVSILDITSNDILYDVGIKRSYVTMTGSVITYTSDNNVVNDNDILRIIVDESGAASPEGSYGALVLTGGDDEDTYMPGMYYKTMTGSGDATFVLPVNTTSAVELIDVFFRVDAAVTISFQLQALSLGATDWQPVPAYTTPTYAADGTSQELNSSFPLRHIIAAGNEYRTVCTVSGACNVGVQVMAVVL